VKERSSETGLQSTPLGSRFGIESRGLLETVKQAMNRW